MPPTVACDAANEDAARELRERLGATAADPEGEADLLLTEGAPVRHAVHIAFTGPLDDDIDAWDRAVAPQTLAGALWIVPGQDAAQAARGWWLLRHETPPTPLSDLTDTHGRALRWSVVGVSVVELPRVDTPDVDDSEIRAWLDGQDVVQGLGRALDRIGGDDAEAVLASVEAFRGAVAHLDTLADLAPAPAAPALDAAVADHLRQVQRSGFGRWRAGKARAQTQTDLTAAAKSVAADRLREVIAARHAARVAEQEHAAGTELATRTRDLVRAGVMDLTLPHTPDFAASPRSWGSHAPEPRRHVLVAEGQAQGLGDLEAVNVRESPLVAADEVVCVIIQSGFSLPALMGS